MLAVLVLVVFLRVHGNLRGLSGQFRAKYPKNYLVSNGDTSGLNLKQLKFNSNDLRSDLSKAFPYDPSKPIPRRVWQTWKVPIDSPEFPGDLKPYVSGGNPIAMKLMRMRYIHKRMSRTTIYSQMTKLSQSWRVSTVKCR